MKIKTAFMALLLLGIVIAGPARAEAEDDVGMPMLRGALVKVHFTTQGWSLESPWQKGSPRSQSMRGVVVLPGLVLAPANYLADLIMVEVSEVNSARRYPASLAHIDYGANLALIKIEDEGLRSRTAPLPLAEPVTIDDEFDVWQLGDSDLLERYTGRVQRVYVQAPRLQLQIKTNLADRGDGQPMIRKSGLAGLVVATYASRQEGQVISVETISRFLEDYKSGDERGYAGGGLWFQEMLRDDLRAHHKVPEDEHGLLVSNVVPGRTGHGVLEVGDVITHIAGHDLDDEGMYAHEKHGRISGQFLMFCGPPAGTEVAARILRDGEAKDVMIPLRGWPVEAQRVPAQMYDQRPPYYILGGMVILELNYRSNAQDHSLREYRARAWWDHPSERKRIVYANRVLSDPANKGLDDLFQSPILTVNGKTITRIQDIPPALEHPVRGFHVVTFEGVDAPFVVKADERDEIDKRIAERYLVSELFYLGE